VLRDMLISFDIRAEMEVSWILCVLCQANGSFP
jgi:hypothetical protein